MNNTFKKLLINLFLAAVGILLILTRNSQGATTPLRVIICMAYCLYLFIWVSNGFIAIGDKSNKAVQKETI